MFSTNFISMVGSGQPIPAFDPDAQAFFDKVTAAGGTLSTTEEEAVNQLVLDLKSYSIWSDLQAVYPMVGASNAACKQNLISSSFTGTFNGSWTFSASGVDPDGGAGTYFDTGWNPSLVSDVMNNHYGIYTTQNEPDSFRGFGVFDGFDRRWFTFLCLFNNTYYEQANFFVEYVNSGVNRGFSVINSNAGTLTGYFTGASVGSVSYIDNGEPNGNFWFGGINMLQGGFPDQRMTANITFGTLGYELNSTQVANYYTAVQTFQTTLGRQI